MCPRVQSPQCAVIMPQVGLVVKVFFESNISSKLTQKTFNDEGKDPCQGKFNMTGCLLSFPFTRLLVASALAQACEPNRMFRDK